MIVIKAPGLCLFWLGKQLVGKSSKFNNDELCLHFYLLFNFWLLSISAGGEEDGFVKGREERIVQEGA